MAIVPQGFNSGGTFTNDATIGSVNWTNPGNAAANDSVYATAAGLMVTNQSKYLAATNFSFSIPTDATIVGIYVEVDRYKSTGAGINDYSVKIIKGGTISGNEKKLSPTWDTSDLDTYVSYGSPTDLWGVTWAVSDINATNFGVGISATGVDLIGSTANIDHIRMTVYYEPVGGDPEGKNIQFEIIDPQTIDFAVQPQI